MALRISICLCNKLFAEGIKRLIEGNRRKTDFRISVVDPKEVTTKTDLLISDCRVLSQISLDSFFDGKVSILLLLTGCLPELRNQRLLEYITNGLIGVLPLNADASQLMEAIKCIATGGLWFDKTILKDIICNLKNDHVEFTNSLTAKEMEIVKNICKGYRNKEITKHLKIGEQAVKKHLNTIYKKLGVADRL